jgi:hypothetical protein
MRDKKKKIVNFRNFLWINFWREEYGFSQSCPSPSPLSSSPFFCDSDTIMEEYIDIVCI